MPDQNQQLLENEYDSTVRADIEQFRAHAEKWLAKEITDDQFRAQRLRRGVYGQRQEGVQMIRTKIPGGLLTADQMRTLAEVADAVAGGKGHLTTRQNMQYHFVPLLDVPKALHMLADARMTTREACYNTVRNVTADPLAGLLPSEPFNVQPYAAKLAFAFLHKELTDAMPRKFKIALAGGEEDTIGTRINDLGLRGIQKDGVNGFRMTVAGGLGPLPTECKVMYEFFPAEEVVSRVEAVIRVFAQYGNYGNKDKARLKFILRERGWDWLRDMIEEKYQDILRDGGIPMPASVPENFGGFQTTAPVRGTGELLPIFDPSPEFAEWRKSNVRDQKQAGYGIVTVMVPQGNLTGDQMRGLAKIAEDAGDGLMRVSMSQNIMFAWVPVGALGRVYGALAKLGLGKDRADEISDVVTCPGAYSCNLALTKSMGLGDALAFTVRKYDDPSVRDLKIRISGCPNSCGQHWIGDLGFYGNARKINGVEVPYYKMLVGGTEQEFGLTVQSLPARNVPVAVDRILEHFMANREGGESFREYVKRFKVETFKKLTADLEKPPADADPEIFMDWGDNEKFSLQLGRGECAA
jgi:sulfite reductase beta subunit-like hemoprotein